jgi:hypothetical protein
MKLQQNAGRLLTAHYLYESIPDNLDALCSLSYQMMMSSKSVERHFGLPKAVQSHHCD